MKKKTAMKLVGTAALTTGALCIAEAAAAKYVYNNMISRRRNRQTHIDLGDGLTHVQSMHMMNEKEIYLSWIEKNKKQKATLWNKEGYHLVADVYTNTKATHKWVLLCHGYLGSKEDMVCHARHFVENGYHCLAPDARGHGQSSGNYIGMGWKDRLDVIEWIKYIINLDKDAEIILFGISLGASAIMMASGETLPENVKAIIEDGGYTSVYDEISYQIRHTMKVPASIVSESVGYLIRHKNHYCIHQASALEQIKKSSLPMFFIHGDADTFAPTKMAYKLYDACPNYKDIYIVKNSAHGNNIFADPTLYFKEIFTFLKNI